MRPPLRELSLDEFASRWTDVERAVDATAGIDHWCSGPDWILSVNAGFAPDNEHILLEADNNAGFVALDRYQMPNDLTLLGCLEPLWGFGCPIVGSDLSATTKTMVEYLHSDPSWDVAYLTGFPASGSEPRSAESEPIRPDQFTIDAANALSSVGHVSLQPGIARQTARLDQGFEHWLSTRSSKFRRNLRKASRAAAHAGLVIEDVSSDRQIFNRLLSIEHRSWKGKDDSGITSAEMQTMYSTMFHRLAERKRLLAHVALIDGEDVGYIVGGLRNRRYRGLQLSYVDDHDELSIGNILQNHQIQALCADQLADIYDLGMDFGYKRSWADHAERSVAIAVRRS